MRALRAVTFAASILAVGVPLSAHHSWPVNMSQLVTVTGTVTRVMWANPHPMFFVDVQGQNGETEEWQIGGPALNRMAANGWEMDTVQPGDVVTGEGFQFSDGQRIVRLERMTLPDGTVMRLYGRR